MIILCWVFAGTMVGSSLAVTALTIADALNSREQPAYLRPNSQSAQPEPLTHPANVSHFTASCLLSELQRQGTLKKSRGKLLLDSAYKFTRTPLV